MIHFLRKIRRSLIEPLPRRQAGQTSGGMEGGSTRISASPFGRYILYSVGEILLVMIGILLALQVNNWNEKRKSIIKEKSYVRAIYQDLKDDITNIDSNWKTVSDHYYLGLEILESLDLKNMPSIDSIKISTNLGWKLSQVIPVDRDENTWDRLKVLGTDAVIINDSITTVLNAFYAKYDKQIERFNQLPKKLRQELRELTGFCHNAKGLEVLREKGIEYYGASSPQTRKCILSIGRNQELVGAIMVTSIVNTKIYEALKNDANIILMFMEDQFDFINNET